MDRTVLALGDVGRTVRERARAVLNRSTAAPAAAIWLGMYVLVVLTGQKFDTNYLNFGWQLLPWDILSNDPWTSVWYLHIQPPLWNLVLGVGAWSSPLSDAATLQCLMASFGLLAAGSAAVLGERMGLSRRSAFIVASVATMNPEVLKGAFEPTYELPVAAGLLAMLAIVAGLKRDDGRFDRRLVAVGTMVTLLVMTRSLYHPLWAVAVLGLVVFLHRGRASRRALVAAAAVPVVVIGGWILKNDVLFGQPNLSSWFGMNLQRAVIPVLDLEELQEMRERNEVSEIAVIGPFGKYSLYEDVVDPCTPTRANRAVSEPMRTTDQWSPNFNYECYLPIFEQAGHDAWAVMREHPDAWLEGRLWSLRSTVSVAVTPSESSSIVMRELDRVYSWLRLDYPGVLSTRGWGTPIYGQLTAPVDFGLVLVPLYAGVLLVGFVPVIRRIRHRSRPNDTAVLVVASFTVGFTVLVGAVAELGEQARFRTMTDPLCVVVAAAVIARVTRRKQRVSEGTSLFGRLRSVAGVRPTSIPREPHG